MNKVTSIDTELNTIDIVGLIDHDIVQNLANNLYGRNLSEAELKRAQKGLWVDPDASIHLLEAIDCAIVYAVEGDLV